MLLYHPLNCCTGATSLHRAHPVKGAPKNDGDKGQAEVCRVNSCNLDMWLWRLHRTHQKGGDRAAIQVQDCLHL